VPNRISNRQKAEELRHRKARQAERADALGGKSPVRLVPVPSAAKRAPEAARRRRRLDGGKSR
jgi:hypothetical protein